MESKQKAITPSGKKELTSATILELVDRFYQNLLSGVSLDVLYTSIGEELRKIFPDYYIAIATLDATNQLEYFEYNAENGIVTYPAPQKYNRIRAELIDHGKQILVNSHAHDFVAQFLGHDYARQSGLQVPLSFLFAPFVVDREVKGYISLKHYQKEAAFEAIHTGLLKTIASAISVALKNEWLLKDARQNVEEQKALLQTMNDLTSQTDLRTLLEAVLERAIGLLKVTGGELAIFQEELNVLEVVTSQNLGMVYSGTKLLVGEGAMGTVAATREPLLIPDYQQWSNRSGKYTHTIARSVMAVPLLMGEQLVGVLCAVHLEEGRVFGTEDLRLLNLFAPLAATAIHNGRLFDAEQKKAAEQIALLDTMQDISSKLDVQIVLQSVVERSVELLKVTGGELAIYQPETETLEIVASFNLGSDTRGLRMKVGEGAMGYAAKHKEALIIPNYQEWMDRSEKYTTTAVYGVMVVPLISKGQLVGALCSVHLEKERVFTQNDLRLLNLFAPLAATAIENALLFEQTNLLLNVSEQRAEALKRTQEQLVQQEKLASLGEVTAGIAHEIQNPLNFVNNFSEVSYELMDEMSAELEKGALEEVRNIAAGIKQNLEKIAHHGKRADAIVKGMLQHSRNSTGQKEMTDINALCDEYLRLAYHGIRARDNSFNAQLETDFDLTIQEVLIQPHEIGRVILNLINNALYEVGERKKTMPEGYQPTVLVGTKVLDNRIEIRVQDNGKGIPEAIREKIFQPFFTTKPTGQGTGLGLSLSYDIVKAHGGEMQVQSKEQEGTVFTIRL